MVTFCTLPIATSVRFKQRNCALKILGHNWLILLLQQCDYYTHAALYGVQVEQ